MSRKRTTIADDTVLLPHIIADGVCGELYRLAEYEHRHLSSWLAARAERIYRKNDHWARGVLRKDGREYLYMFMRHWAAGFVLMRTGRRVNQQWAVGQPYHASMK